jgi:hypothetical protein
LVFIAATRNTATCTSLTGTATGRAAELLRSLILLAPLALAACAGGAGEAVNTPALSATPTDLDTARQPPQTVTQMPLLPPVNEPQPVTEAPSAPPAAQHLYTEDEQARIQAELDALARAQKP